jgi:uncharacterized membrane protein
MTLLITGLVLFIGIHLLPQLLGLKFKTSIKLMMGEKPYKAAFSVLSLAGLILIVIGYPQAPADHLFITFYEVYWGLLILSVLGVFIFIAGQFPGSLKQWFDHPMMIGTAIWSLSHLGMNGDLRSVILFGSLFVWSTITTILLFKREGKQSKVSKGWKIDVISVAVALGVITVITLFTHQYIGGVELYLF